VPGKNGILGLNIRSLNLDPLKISNTTMVNIVHIDDCLQGIFVDLSHIEEFGCDNLALC